MPDTQPVTHIFTVDVEEYFQVGALERVIPRESWESWPTRAEPALRCLTDVLARHGVKATCFVLGWFAKRNRALVRALADTGHEIASHGWSHRSLVDLTPASLRAELRRSKDLLEDITGQRVLGFRAPNFSLVPGTEWAFDALLDEGYEYDSSLFVHRQRRGSGYPGACVRAHEIRRSGGTLFEIPVAVRGWAGVRVPASGGGYFRHLPYGVTRAAFAAMSRQGAPGVFYIHPWELDVEQPRVRASLLTRLRHYAGIPHTASRLDRLLSEFSFTSIARHPSIGAARAAAGTNGLTRSVMAL